jgi:predicted transposase YbfD/YdcC
MRTIALVRSERRIGDETSTCDRFYISNIAHQANRLLAASRAHWHIENRLPWYLDVAFNEDRSRVRKGFGQENLVILRKLALTLLRREKTLKVGLKAKRLSAGWDHDYLLKILTS